MGDWLKEHGVDTALGIGGIVGLGGIVAFSKEVADLWRDHPWPLAFCCLLSFALGTWFYHAQGRKDAYVERKREERARLREEEAARVRRRDTARARILGLTPWEKRYLLALRDRGQLVTDYMPRRDFEETLMGVADLVERTAVEERDGMCRWRVSLSERGEYAASVAGDVLEEVLEYGEK